MKKVILQFDGLCQAANYPGTVYNNGQIASFGWVIRRGDRVLDQGSGSVPPEWGTSPHVASYMALIAGLKALVAMGPEGLVEIRGDSKLVIDQMRGKTNVQSPQLLSLHREARELVQRLRRVKWRRVPKKQNGEAEALSWQAYADVWQAGRHQATMC
jgi:ribonuclease HI